MADVKISGLPASTIPLAGTEVLPIVQGGQTRQVSVANLTAGRAIAAVGINNSGVLRQGILGTSTQSAVIFNPDTSGNTIFWVKNDTGQFAVGTGSNPYSGGVERFRLTELGGANLGGTSDPGDGNFALKGNFVPSTAAKGVNFTANTPAAGMTSQLLNWYEEGTWTPVVSGTWSTTPTIYGTARYTRIGRQVTLTFAFLDGALATNTDGYFTGLPFTPADVGTGAVVDNNIVNRGLCEATSAGRIWVTNTSFPDVNYISITYFV